jgi:hypothetical protein
VTRPIAVDTITQQHAIAVLGMLGVTPGEAPKDDTVVWHVILAAMFANEAELERLERSFEGLVSAVRLYREKSTPGMKILAQISAATPF